MIPVVGRELAIVLIIVAFGVIAAALVIVLVASSTRQQRRYLRTREHLGGRLLTAQDEERAAIARELHDDVVQRLLAVAAGLRSMGTAELGRATTELDQVTSDLRNLARGIHPTIVDHLGLGPALMALGESVAEHDGVSVNYEGPEGSDTLPSRVRLALYRVAQEALGNVAHHAKTTVAWVELRQGPREARLSIRDEGQGMDLDRAELGPGIGLTSMKERVELLGGTLEIDSRVGKGTTVTAVLPLRGSGS